jgi:hypothetical protein
MNPSAIPSTPESRTSPYPMPRGYTSHSSRKVPPATTHPHPARTRSEVSPSSPATTARTTTTAYDGAMTRVGSSRVRQSTTARATPTGTRYATSSRSQTQPSRAPTSPPTTAAATAALQPSPGSAAMET